MALANAVQHARKRAQTITWKDEDDAAIDLTGATITGIIERARILGCRPLIQSAPGHGTTITLKLPTDKATTV